tara:strand:+ start:351717 stop:352346 length:630 start_codon:yes stop_codon:yes gene_type:complete
MRKLTLKIFEKHLALYGADLNRWPGFVASDIREFIAAHDHALDLYMDAQSLDRALDDFSVPDAKLDVIAAALAQIKREDSAESLAANDIKTPAAIGSNRPNQSWGLFGWGSLPRPAYALASVICVLLVMVFAAPPAHNKLEGVLQSVAVDGLIKDLEQLEAAGAAQQDLLMAFAEVEDDIKIDNYLDHLGLDLYVPMSDDIWDYLVQQG